MTRATKKELNAALAPLFSAYDRYANGLTSSAAPRVAKPAPIQWRGLTFDIQLVRRSRTLTNVPFPFAVFEFLYETTVNGQRMQMNGRPSFIDHVFAYHRRNGIDFQDAAL